MVSSIGFTPTDRTVVGFYSFLKTFRTDATNAIQLQEILLLPYSVRLRSVVIDAPLTGYPLSRAGTVLYVTLVNIILAMRINALYKGNPYCGVFLGSLVVGELHLRETSHSFQPTF